MNQFGSKHSHTTKIQPGQTEPKQQSRSTNGQSRRAAAPTNNAGRAKKQTTKPKVQTTSTNRKKTNAAAY